MHVKILNRNFTQFFLGETLQLSFRQLPWPPSVVVGPGHDLKLSTPSDFSTESRRKRKMTFSSWSAVKQQVIHSFSPHPSASHQFLLVMFNLSCLCYQYYQTVKIRNSQLPFHIHFIPWMNTSPWSTVSPTPPRYFRSFALDPVTDFFPPSPSPCTSLARGHSFMHGVHQ